MKKNVLSLLLAACSPLLIWAQGIHFEEGSFSEALAKAKQENKIVFVDIYTTWCGPCKKMAKEFFPTQEAGDKYNTHFINYKIDAEKGEGIDVAKKYNVHGYPTSLYLRPDGSLVYTSMGISNLQAFLQNADVALAESKDPMSWEDYMVQYDQGKTDKIFLTKLLEKAKRLHKNNDAILDVYTSKYIPKQATDKDLLFLADNVATVDNKAYVILNRQSAQLNELKAETPDFFQNLTQVLLVPTAEKMGKSGTIERLNSILLPVLQANSRTPETDMLFYREYFYRAKGNEDDMKQFMIEKARILTDRTAATYASEDLAKKEETIIGLKNQLIAAKVPQEQQQAQIDMVIDRNPAISRMVSFQAANDLNSIAWGVYQAKEKAYYKEALSWSKRALELISKNFPAQYAAMQDTYAHLLYIDGQKAAAVTEQTQALEALKNAGMTDGIEDMEASLEAMKNGTL